MVPPIWASCRRCAACVFSSSADITITHDVTMKRFKSQPVKHGETRFMSQCLYQLTNVHRRASTYASYANTHGIACAFQSRPFLLQKAQPVFGLRPSSLALAFGWPIVKVKANQTNSLPDPPSYHSNPPLSVAAISPPFAQTECLFASCSITATKREKSFRKPSKVS